MGFLERWHSALIKSPEQIVVSCFSTTFAFSEISSQVIRCFTGQRNYFLKKCTKIRIFGKRIVVIFGRSRKWYLLDYKWTKIPWKSVSWAQNGLFIWCDYTERSLLEGVRHVFFSVFWGAWGRDRFLLLFSGLKKPVQEKKSHHVSRTTKRYLWTKKVKDFDLSSCATRLSILVDIHSLGDVTPADSQRRFLAQHSVAML